MLILCLLYATHTVPSRVLQFAEATEPPYLWAPSAPLAPDTPTTNSLPDSGDAPSPSSMMLVMYSWSRAGPPKATAVTLLTGILMV